MPTSDLHVEVDGGAEAAKVRAAQRDLRAFDQLYVDYAQALYRYLYSRLNNTAEAEEVMSQTFLAALEAFPHYRHRGHFAAWLFTIARNKAADHFRREARQTPLAEAERLPAKVDLMQETLDRERVQALAQRMDRLDEEERELLRLRFVAELSFEQMAALLQRKRDTVKKALYRLLARLQREMEAADD